MATKLPTVAIIGRANAGKSSLFNRMVRSQQAIVARVDAPFNNLAEMIAWAKKNPGKLNFGSAGAGTGRVPWAQRTAPWP